MEEEVSGGRGFVAATISSYEDEGKEVVGSVETRRGEINSREDKGGKDEIDVT